MWEYLILRYNNYIMRREIEQIRKVLEEYKELNQKLGNIKNISNEYKEDD